MSVRWCRGHLFYRACSFSDCGISSSEPQLSFSGFPAPGNEAMAMLQPQPTRITELSNELTANIDRADNLVSCMLVNWIGRVSLLAITDTSAVRWRWSHMWAGLIMLTLYQPETSITHTRSHSRTHAHTHTHTHTGYSSSVEAKRCPAVCWLGRLCLHL